jgi:hypothetical protein
MQAITLQSKKSRTSLEAWFMGTLIHCRSFLSMSIGCLSREAEYNSYSPAAKKGELLQVLLRDPGHLLVILVILL